MKLINEKTGKPVIAGDTLKTFRGERVTVSDPVGSPPMYNGSTGRIYVRKEGCFQEFFPSVCGCKWTD